MSISKDTPTSEKNSPGAIYQPAIGESIANKRYKIVSYLGQGGMGQVYKAIDTVLDRIVAIKLLNYVRLEGKQAIRFQQEAKALSNLSNDGILSVYDFGLTENDFPFMATEFVDGLTLKKYLQKNSNLSTKESISIAIQIAEAMSHAHKKNIVHRDLKPENIILTNVKNEATVKILDFGISKIVDLESSDQFQTPSGQIVGSPKYISPEQAANLKNVDCRSDIYSLGCILFECLTGCLPFLNSTTISTIEAHINQEAPKLSDKAKGTSFNSILEEIVSKCLKKSPDDRYQNMSQLLDSLKEAIQDEASAEIDEDTLERVEIKIDPLARSNKVALGFIFVLFSFAIIVITYLLSKPKTNTIGEIQSSQNLKVHNNLDVSKDLARKKWTFQPKEKLAKFKSYTDVIPVIALTKLKSTKFSDIEFKSSGLEEGMIKELAIRLPKLRKLSIYGSGIANNDLIAIRDFDNLQSLNLKNCDLKDSSIDYLEPNRKLEFLSLEKNPKLTKVSLAKIISYYPNLTGLDIGNTSIKSKDFSMLKKLPKIRNLDLQRLNLTDNDLDLIASLPNIRQIDLGHNEEITIKGLEKFSNITNRRIILKVKDLFRITNKQMRKFQKTHWQIKVKDFYSKSSKMYRQRIRSELETNHI